MRYGGWWPDYQLRLFLRGSVRYDEKQDPHEVLLYQGPVGYLHPPLLHYNYTSLGQLFSKQWTYALREARSLHNRGVRPKLRSLLGGPLKEFYRRYILWEGYKAGALGLLLALVMAWYRLMVLYHLAQIEPGAKD